MRRSIAAVALLVRDYRAMEARGVKFCETPREEPYGVVAAFEDLYGNRWDLLEPSPDIRSASPPDP